MPEGGVEIWQMARPIALIICAVDQYTPRFARSAVNAEADGAISKASAAKYVAAIYTHVNDWNFALVMKASRLADADGNEMSASYWCVIGRYDKLRNSEPAAIQSEMMPWVRRSPVAQCQQIRSTWAALSGMTSRWRWSSWWCEALNTYVHWRNDAGYVINEICLKKHALSFQ